MTSQDLAPTPQPTEAAMFAEIERVARLLIAATCDVIRADGHGITEPMLRLITERCLADARDRYSSAVEARLSTLR